MIKVIPIFWRHITNVFRKMASDNVNEQRVVKSLIHYLENLFPTYARTYTQFMETPVYRKVPFLSGWIALRKGETLPKVTSEKADQWLFRMKWLKFRNTVLKIEGLLLKMLRNTLVFRMVQLRILCLTSLECDVFRQDGCRACCFRNSWLVGCLGFNGPLRQYFSLYRAVSQREGERGEKW